jgi:sirohydrochlorin ferrochelatase
MRHPPVSAVLLVAHGSRDPRAAATTRALARAVAGLLPGAPVRVAFLDHGGPRVAAELGALAAGGHTAAVVVPLLLTSAYHNRVDLPAVLVEARAAGLSMDVDVADVLGPVHGAVPAPLLAALRRRLRETGSPYDGLVLAAAGTRDAAARSTVDDVAAALGVAVGVPCRAAFASAAAPAPDAAVRALHAAGAGRVAVAAYFLATGRLYQAAADSARAAGAVAVAAPLGDAVELARLVVDRVATTRPVPAGAVPAGAVPARVRGRELVVAG